MSSGAPDRGRAPIFWLVGAAVAGMLIFSPGLFTWFQLDDFIWIAVGRRAAERGWWATLLTATPQGTWRPITDGLFFAVFGKLFGLDARPYRALVFATYAVDVVLVGVLAWRLGAGRREALLAGVFFGVNAGLSMPMSWTCSYNQVAAVACLASALLAWQAYCERGGTGRYVLVLLLQVIGCLVLEVQIVFPLIAALFVLLLQPRARWPRLALALAPLAAVSLGWTVLHVVHAPPAVDGPYRARVGWVTLSTLWRYWNWTVMPPHYWESNTWTPLVPIAAILLTGAVTVSAFRRGDRRPLFFAGMYVLILAPALTLPDHVVENIVAAPALAFGLLLAATVAAVWGRGTSGRVTAVVVAGAFVVVSSIGCFDETRQWARHGAAIEPAMRGLVQLRAREPAVLIRIRDADGELLRHAIGAGALQLLGLDPACIELGEATAQPCSKRDADALAAGRVFSARTLAIDPN